jgi:hypothetical protein
MTNDANNNSNKKIGSFSTVDIQNWMSTPINNSKQKRTKKNKDIIHPIFLELSEISTDNIWKNIFVKASIDKFPPNFSAQNNFLIFKKRSQSERYEIKDNSISSLEETIEFFKKYGGFCEEDSDADIFEYLISQSENYSSWSQIRGKKKKDYFLSRYIDTLNQKYDLNPDEKQQLYTTIYFGYCLKIIDSANIKMENMQIVDINNLFFDNLKRKFRLEGEQKLKKSSRKRSSNDKVPKTSYLHSWIKYIQKINNITDNSFESFKSQFSESNTSASDTNISTTL